MDSAVTRWYTALCVRRGASVTVLMVTHCDCLLDPVGRSRVLVVVDV